MPERSGRPAARLRDVWARCDLLLESSRFRDYVPNGLQVEGRPAVSRLACAVTASLAVVDAALRWRADALLVHHGWFWRSDSPVVSGVRRARLARLLRADVSLLAYHLPLDVHPELGNNACLGRLLGWESTNPFGEYGLGSLCRLARPMELSELTERVSDRLGRAPLVIPGHRRKVRRVAWCTGAAQDMIEAASVAGADTFLSGEVSERTTHLARELGVNYIAAGHHATERGGVQALAARLGEEFGLTVRFFDEDNPV